MKMILFGIAAILFALLLALTPAHFPLVSSIMGRDEMAFLAGSAGLVIAGMGAFRKD